MAYGDGGSVSLELGPIIQRATNVMAKRAVVILGVALLLYGVPSALQEYYQTQMTAAANGAAESGNSSSLIGYLSQLGVATIVAFIGGCLLQIFVNKIAIDEMMEGQVDVPAVLGGTARWLLPVIGLNILSWTAISFAGVLLIVPGVILFVVWSLAVPALIADRVGVMGSLGRSAYLTRGARWPLFGFFVGAVLLYLVPLGVLVLMQSGLGLAGSTTIIAMSVKAIITSCAYAFWLTLIAAAFVELREIKDGTAGDRLSEVFA